MRTNDSDCRFSGHLPLASAVSSVEQSGSNMVICHVRTVVGAMICVSCFAFAVPITSAAELNPHPSREWTAPEKAVFREALREWGRPGLTFREVIDCRVPVDFTVRWEDSDFFRRWDATHDWSGDYGRYLSEEDLPAGWNRTDFPVNEIYFRSDLAMGWFIDPIPADDAEYPVREGNDRIAEEGTAAFERMDFLTAAKHEIGHRLDLAHDADGVMRELLLNGTRRHPTDDEKTRATAGEYTYKFMPVAIPEPEFYAMLLSGLGLLGFFARRRKQNAA